jgi:hypothetical protein
VALAVVGAGLGRTGTNSLKLALEELLGGTCYHMFELTEHPDDLPAWERAVQGEAVDWDALLNDYAAAVDWPASAFWREILAANPDAVVLLSTRDSAEVWWASMERTIVAVMEQPDHPDHARRRTMTRELLSTRFTPDWRNRDAAIAAYERHNTDVRGAVDAGRLIDWKAGDGWEPICSALGVPVPSTPFPHENRSAQFRSAVGLDPPTA